MVLIEAEVHNLSEFKKATDSIADLKKKAKKRVLRGVANIPGGKSTRLKDLYQESPTKLGSITNEIQAQSSAEIEEVIVFNEGVAHNRMLGSVRTQGKSLDTVLRKFRAENNMVFLSIPSISKSHVIALRPKSSELVVTKDNRGTNLYNIALSSKAIKRVGREFSGQVEKLLTREADNLHRRTGQRHNSGLEIELSGKMGVAADKIHVMPALSGVDLTSAVRKQVRLNMRKDTPYKSFDSNAGFTRFSRSKSTKKLTNRTGGFVGSIHASLEGADSIAYDYDTAHYGIHEKPLGSFTDITPKNKRVLAFTNKKTGDKVFTKRVRVYSRPVIKRSIREVALRLFNRRFNIVQR